MRRRALLGMTAVLPLALAGCAFLPDTPEAEVDRWLDDHPLVLEHNKTVRNTSPLGRPGDYLCGATVATMADAKQFADEFKEYGATARLSNYRLSLRWADGAGTTSVTFRRDWGADEMWAKAETPMPEHVISRSYAGATRFTTQPGKVEDVALMTLSLDPLSETHFSITDGEVGMSGQPNRLARRVSAIRKLRTEDIEAISPDSDVEVFHEDLEQAREILGDDFPDITVSARHS